MKISLLMEGRTEQMFLQHLRAFLGPRLPGVKLTLDPVPFAGLIPRRDRLKGIVRRLLDAGSDYVVCLTDVYTGQARFADAADAIQKLEAEGGHHGRFFAHAAQYEFEAWLLPYWDRIRRIADCSGAGPRQKPEHVNHSKPPSKWIAEAFRTGTKGLSYMKVRDANRILRGCDLTVAVEECPQLKAFINRLLELGGGVPV